MTANNGNDIVRRTLTGSFFTVSSASITLTLGLIRTILLLKLLQPGDFGVVTQALFFVNLAGLVRLPGLDLGFIHRKEIDETTLPTYFTLRISLFLFSSLIIALLTPIIDNYYPDMPLLGIIILVYLVSDIIGTFSSVQDAIHSRELHFKEIATTNVISALAMTLVAPLLAWQGFGVWSLVAEQVVGISTRLICFMFSPYWWRPRFGWNRNEARWFRDFGLKGWANTNILFFLDRFDDFWVGTYLGKTQLGYYAKSYELARYPRRIVAAPLLSVFYPTFAKLQNDREQLSKAFVRTSAIMIRFGFWISLLLVVSAPELIQFLGQEWLPMQATLQLMVVYTMLDPVAIAAANLLQAIGYPEILSKVRIYQAIFFIPAVMWLGKSYGIEGVAIAANGMVLVGTVLLYFKARRFVDFSIKALWLWPLLALTVSGMLYYILSPYLITSNNWITIIIKSVFISVTYLFILFLVERKRFVTYTFLIYSMLRPYWQLLRSRFAK